MRFSSKQTPILSAAILLLFGTLLAGTPLAAQSHTPSLSVNIATGRYPINPNIYGIANYGLDPAFAQEIKVPNIRWGGDGTTRYNWQVDSSNAGFDWYFMGGSGAASPVPGASVDTMIRSYPTAGALITIPIIPYVNKTSAWNCSFPTSVYGAQKSTNPYVHPNGEDCGNSIAANNSQLLDSNIYANHIDNSAALQQSWVQHLVATFGTAAEGGVPFYQLDNEPYGWGNTHRDVEPDGADYTTILALGQQYAAVVKQVDPSAAVLGPSDFTLGGWIGNTSQQNGLYAAQYYLQQMAAYDQAHGVRILDYLDEHYYPQFSDPASQLASTRTFWDPTYNGGTWVEQYVFGAPMQLLPRMQSWVSQYYPGTKISLSEYSIDSGNKRITDALAEMDVLGIFGRQQLNFANMWTAPSPADPIAFSFRMFRNYDGQGSQYGDTWVNTTSSDEAQLSVYAAQRTSDSVVTILVINKTTSAISTSLQLSGMNLPQTASVFSYSGTNLKEIVNNGTAQISGGNIFYNFPQYSATLFALTPASPAATSTTLTASSSQVTVGQSVTLTAVVSGTGKPSGTVTFNDGGTAIGSPALTSGQSNLSTAALSIGTHSITAVYSGDASNAASTSQIVTVTVNANPPVLAATRTVLSASPTQITIGQTIQFAALISGPASPSGTVAFLDGATPLGNSPLISGQATFSAASLPAGVHSITAAYSGDASNAASTSQIVTVTVNSSPPVLAATRTVLNASATQITIGQTIHFAALISGTASPSGTVAFLDGAIPLGNSPLISGQATFSAASLPAGVHSITAVYSGDANNAASTSQIVTVTVNPSTPVLTATRTVLNASATQITTGQTIQFAALISGTASPSGTVAFLDGAIPLGNSPLISGQAIFSAASLPAGVHSITAVYSGDANNAPSTSSVLTITVLAPSQPSLSVTTITLSATASQLTPGQSITLTASVSGSSSPGGSVTFNDSNLSLGTVFLATGQASLSTTSLAVGTHFISAIYGGDANDAPSTSTMLTVIVTQPALVPAATTNTNLSASASQITAGQSMSLTATVAAAAGSPTGNVTFNSSNAMLGTAPVDGGTAVFSSSGLAVGTYAITATYGGDMQNLPSTSPAIALSVVAPVQAPAASPSFTLALAQSAMTLSPGASGRTNLSIVPQNGFASPVTLSCTGLPAGATCSFSPGLLTPGSSFTSNLTVNTSPNASLFGALLLLPWILPFAARIRRQWRALLIASACSLVLIVGCGVQVNKSISGAPAGTYNIQVVGVSSTNETQTQPLTLTIQ